MLMTLKDRKLRISRFKQTEAFTVTNGYAVTGGIINAGAISRCDR